jgi:hypothetical protein
VLACGLALTQPMNAYSRQAKQIAWAVWGQGKRLT